MTAIVIAGSTGEAATLDPDERVALVGAVRTAVPAGVPVIAGTGAPSTRQAVRLTSEAAGEGTDGVLALTPPGSADLERSYAAVVAAASTGPSSATTSQPCPRRASTSTCSRSSRLQASPG